MTGARNDRNPRAPRRTPTAALFERSPLGATHCDRGWPRQLRQGPDPALGSSGRPRVLHFGRFDSPNYGGLERHVRLLLKGLAPFVQADNLVSQDSHVNAQVETRDGYRVYRAPSWGLLASVPLSPGLVTMARRLWRENGYEIAHLHFPDPLAHLAASLLPSDARIVITWHSDIVRQRHFMRLYQPLLDRILERADAIVAATPLHFSTSTQLRNVRDRGKLHVIPYGLDYRLFDLRSSIAARVSEIRRRYANKPIVFSVGRHVYYKGFEYLVQAATMMDAHVLIGGSGPMQGRYLAEVRRSGVADRVTLLGRITDDELAAHFHACDVFCMPSVERSEAFGLVQLEAMACGKPVVCCDLGNGVTFVNRHDETGLVVAPRDPGALAGAIECLVRDPELSARLGEAGRRRARCDFPVHRMVEQHLALYDQLVGRSP